MKIWLDTSPHSHFNQLSDCNDCSGQKISDVPISWPLAEDEITRARTLRLKRATPLSIQLCGEERWCGCIPTGSGRMAVLDAQAMSLFSLFETPITISQTVDRITPWAPEALENIIALFYHLGFLRDIANPTCPCDKVEVQTLTAWLHVTNACNLRCHYCYLYKTPEPMAADVGRKAIDAIFRSAMKNKFKHIKLKYAGGEASLQMKKVIALHDYAAQLAQGHGILLEAVLLSNGVSLSQHAIEQMKTRDIAVTLSLDGLGECHNSQRPLVGGGGSDQYILRTINRLLANEIVPFISVTVSRRNLNGLAELIRYILERKLPFSLNYYRDNECSGEIEDLRFTDEQIISAMCSVFAVIEDRLPTNSLLGCLLDKADMRATHTRTCGVGQNYLVIDQHGGVAKCQMEIKQTLTTINVDDPLRVIRQDRRGVQGLPVREKEGCRTCEWRNWCTGGCPVVTYRATGRYDVKSPNCNIYKALFPEVLRLEALRLLRHTTPIAVS